MRYSKMLCAILAFTALIVCSSCLTWTSNIKDSPTIDKNLLDSWELMYQIDDKGNQEKPREATRTLIEFSNDGQVIFNRVDKEKSDSVSNRKGKFRTEKGLIAITDDAGNTVKWPYDISGDSLKITMPEVNKEFHWRRYR